ncbi:hypothetical protein VCRA2116O29_90056 [Vibrio crassostreae]|nr:hypothetical protein VCRA2119O48_10154 [Vibrio crassostreae]CAK2573937.1 hypothetical protein VCRA2116O29_90056 [Vibrio crassostreae]CAK3762320.1 hypothetical protein VCRA212O16_120055 [Vibrio crassostreae]CAK3771420.1 hypothetical protein VCRA2123O74_20162 [Vibrio crassostreae]
MYVENRDGKAILKKAHKFIDGLEVRRLGKTMGALLVNFNLLFLNCFSCYRTINVTNGTVVYFYSQSILNL